MEGLCHILQKPPYQHIQRPVVLLAGAADNPIRAFVALGISLEGSEIQSSLFGDGAQKVRLGVLIRIGAQIGIVGFIMADDLQNILCPSGPPG
ncbi:hypothetical protein D3C76_1641730 [compost metagenome]